MRRATLLAALLLACGPEDEPDLPDPVCNAGNAWSPGTNAFREGTKRWKIDASVAGVRLNAVDFDGDGWTDLAVRSSNSRDDFDEGIRYAWLLRNTQDGSFEDVTEASGIRQLRKGGANEGRASQVWIWADVDNDGDLDVYTGLPDGDADVTDTSELMLNEGFGTFVLGPAGSPIRKGIDNPYGATFTDVDRDGHIDLFVANNPDAQDELFRNAGGGEFTKRTSKAGLITEAWQGTDTLNQALGHAVAWSAQACDLDGNGDPELVVSSYGRSPNHLWLNDGGDFTNHSIASGYAFDHRTDWSDNESARCWCWLNPDDADCAGLPEPAIVCNENADAFRWSHSSDREPFRLGGNSGQTVCADVDNDGDMDLLTTEIVHWDVGDSADPSELLFNDGTGVFDRPGNEVTGLVREHDGATWDDGDITGEVFDFDNDGWPDVYIGSTDYLGTRGLLFHQDAPGQFSPVDPSDGVDHTRSHGSVVADFDRDGDLDFVVGHSTARCDTDCYEEPTVRFFENLSEQSNFVQLHLVGGPGTNAAAIGARVSVTTGGVTQTQEVSGGGGQFGDQSDLVLHFGLGDACEADVTIRWPDAGLSTQKFSVGGGYRYRVVQGTDPAVDWP